MQTCSFESTRAVRILRRLARGLQRRTWCKRSHSLSRKRCTSHLEVKRCWRLDKAHDSYSRGLGRAGFVPKRWLRGRLGTQKTSIRSNIWFVSVPGKCLVSPDTRKIFGLSWKSQAGILLSFGVSMTRCINTQHFPNQILMTRFSTLYPKP